MHTRNPAKRNRMALAGYMLITLGCLLIVSGCTNSDDTRAVATTTTTEPTDVERDPADLHQVPLDQPIAEVLVPGPITTGLHPILNFSGSWQDTLASYVASDTYRDFLLGVLDTNATFDGHVVRYQTFDDPTTQALHGVIEFRTVDDARAAYTQINDAIIGLGGGNPIPGHEGFAVVAPPTRIADAEGNPTEYVSVNGFALQGPYVFVYGRIAPRAGLDSVVASMTSQLNIPRH